MARLNPESSYYGTADEWKAQYAVKEFIGNSRPLYADEAMTQYTDKQFTITALEFREGCSTSYQGRHANGGVAWAVVNFTDAFN